MAQQMSYRFANENDIPLILQFIKDLAHYEHMEDEVTATPELLKEWLFVRKKAEVIFAISEDSDGGNGVEVGFLIFFSNFSTFLGKGGIHIEDLFVIPEYRKLGFGKFLLKSIAEIALTRACGRVELSCLDWNKDAIGFYQKLGATTLDDWTNYRFSGESLERLAQIV